MSSLCLQISLNVRIFYIYFSFSDLAESGRLCQNNYEKWWNGAWNNLIPYNGTNRNVLFQTILIFVTIYGLYGHLLTQDGADQLECVIGLRNNHWGEGLGCLRPNTAQGLGCKPRPRAVFGLRQPRLTSEVIVPILPQVNWI